MRLLVRRKTLESLQVIEVPLSEIWVDSEWNSRGLFAPVDVMSLATQIKERGLIHPVLITSISDTLKDKAPAGTKYRLVAGYRRYMAHQFLSQETIRCTLDESLKDDLQKQSEVNLIENISRQDLDIMQEAKALQRMYAHALTDKAIAKRLNVSIGWVYVRRLVLQQPEDIQKHIAAGTLTQDQIRRLEYMEPEAKYEYVKQIIDAKARGESTRQVIPPKKKKQYKSKAARKAGEISEMLDLLAQFEIFRGTLATRALAWAVGNIDYIQFYADLYADATSEGYEFEVPSEIFGEVLAEVRFREAKQKCQSR